MGFVCSIRSLSSVHSFTVIFYPPKDPEAWHLFPCDRDLTIVPRLYAHSEFPVVKPPQVQEPLSTNSSLSSLHTYWRVKYGASSPETFRETNEINRSNQEKAKGSMFVWINCSHLYILNFSRLYRVFDEVTSFFVVKRFVGTWGFTFQSHTVYCSCNLSRGLTKPEEALYKQFI